jgi:predicted phage tail protein
MTKSVQMILSVLIIIVGWLLAGIGFTTTIGHPKNTMLFLAGIGLFIGGIEGVAISANRK